MADGPCPVCQLCREDFRAHGKLNSLVLRTRVWASRGPCTEEKLFGVVANGLELLGYKLNVHDVIDHYSRCVIVKHLSLDFLQ
jgi:hypothetical protein